MEFNPQMNDREFIGLISHLIHLPAIRRAFLSEVEKLCYLYREMIEESSVFPLPGEIPAPKAYQENVPGVTVEELPETGYRFKLTRQKKEWLQETAPDYLMPPELIDYLVGKIYRNQKQRSLSFILSTGLGIRHYRVSVSWVSRRELVGRLEDLTEQRKHGAAKPGEADDRQVIFINSEKCRDVTDQARIFQMIDCINKNPDQRKLLLHYFDTFLAPLFYREDNREPKDRCL